jgi:hypothetical protein
MQQQLTPAWMTAAVMSTPQSIKMIYDEGTLSDLEDIL